MIQPPPDFNPSSTAKSLLRRSRQGALATLMPDGGDPYCSLVNVASLPEGAPILLISRLAVHTRNILADSRVSLMLHEGAEGDPLEGARIMIAGRAEQAGDADEAGWRRRFLRLSESGGTLSFPQVLTELSGMDSSLDRLSLVGPVTEL